MRAAPLDDLDLQTVEGRAQRQPQRHHREPQRQAEDEQDDVYYANCTEVREAGAAPLRRGDPGYAGHLDRDDDGVACET